MKPLTLLTILSVFVCSASKAQSPQVNVVTINADANGKGKKTIIYNFMNPELPRVQTIKAKQQFEIKLINVNPYLYDVKIDDSTVVYPNQKPSGFDGIFTMPALKEVAASAPPLDSAQKQASSPSVNTQKQLQIDAINKFLNGYQDLIQPAEEILRYPQVIAELERLVFNCTMTAVEVKTAAKDHLRKKLNIDTAARNIAIASFVSLNIENIKKRISTFRDEGEKLKAGFEKELTGVKGLNPYKTIQADIVKKNAVIDAPLDNMKTMLEKINQLEQANIGGKMADSYDRVLSSRIQIVHAVTPNFNADEVILRVKVTKTKEVSCPNQVSSFNAEALVVGGVKIDFSTGLVLNVGNKGFFDQTYRKAPYYTANNQLSTDSITITRNRNNNQVIPSLGVFMNIYSRISTNLNAGAILGASVGTDQRLYYHLGGSAIVGKSSRWILSGGMSIAKANILNGQYQNHQVLRAAEFPADIPVENAFRIGGFFSLSYNLNLIP